MGRIPVATIAAIIGRILLGLLFVLGGFGKVMDPAGTAAYMEAQSPFPGSLALVVGAFEIIAGLVLASGFMSRLSALALIGFTALATIFFHGQVSDPMQAQQALKNLAVIGGLLMVFAYGQQGSRVDVLNEREKRFDAEAKAAHAEGKAEGIAAQPAIDRDGDGHPG